jgi:hypothetical protein
MLNFCEANCSAAVQSETVWYVESGPERKPKEIARSLASTGSLRYYSLRTHYCRAVSLEGGSPGHTVKKANCNSVNIH